jgi:hypothetical protein
MDQQVFRERVDFAGLAGVEVAIAADPALHVTGVDRAPPSSPVPRFLLPAPLSPARGVARLPRPVRGRAPCGPPRRRSRPGSTAAASGRSRIPPYRPA